MSTGRDFDDQTARVSSCVVRLASCFCLSLIVSSLHFFSTFSGLGMGLVVSRLLVGLQHGTIAAFSEGVGRGTTFKIALPLLPEPEQEQSAVTCCSVSENQLYARVGDLRGPESVIPAAVALSSISSQAAPSSSPSPPSSPLPSSPSAPTATQFFASPDAHPHALTASLPSSSSSFAVSSPDQTSTSFHVFPSHFHRRWTHVPLLLVEDQLSSLKLLVRSLKSLGFHLIETAASVKEALDKVPWLKAILEHAQKGTLLCPICSSSPGASSSSSFSNNINISSSLPSTPALDVNALAPSSSSSVSSSTLNLIAPPFQLPPLSSLPLIPGVAPLSDSTFVPSSSFSSIGLPDSSLPPSVILPPPASSSAHASVTPNEELKMALLISDIGLPDPGVLLSSLTVSLVSHHSLNPVTLLLHSASFCLPFAIISTFSSCLLDFLQDSHLSFLICLPIGVVGLTVLSRCLSSLFYLGSFRVSFSFYHRDEGIYFVSFFSSLNFLLQGCQDWTSFEAFASDLNSAFHLSPFVPLP